MSRTEFQGSMTHRSRMDVYIYRFSRNGGDIEADSEYVPENLLTRLCQQTPFLTHWNKTWKNNLGSNETQMDIWVSQALAGSALCCGVRSTCDYSSQPETPKKRFTCTVESIKFHLSDSLTGLLFSSQCTIMLRRVDLLTLVWLRYETFDSFLVVSIGLFPRGQSADKHVSLRRVAAFVLFILLFWAGYTRLVLNRTRTCRSVLIRLTSADQLQWSWKKSWNAVIRSCEEKSEDVCGEMHGGRSSHPDSVHPPPRGCKRSTLRVTAAVFLSSLSPAQTPSCLHPPSKWRSPACGSHQFSQEKRLFPLCFPFSFLMTTTSYFSPWTNSRSDIPHPPHPPVFAENSLQHCVLQCSSVLSTRRRRMFNCSSFQS